MVYGAAVAHERQSFPFILENCAGFSVREALIQTKLVFVIEVLDETLCLFVVIQVLLACKLQLDFRNLYLLHF